jgi:hypothetical protein
MLNPLARHRSTPADDLNGDGIDIESPISSPDSPGYIGKKFISLKVLSDMMCQTIIMIIAILHFFLIKKKSWEII